MIVQSKELNEMPLVQIKDNKMRKLLKLDKNMFLQKLLCD
jgi:hypothetical protein|tara:strand:- start:1219 stop:1338 length:120 start_codon:yes stop_codon:yes gene_type:complete